MKIGEIPQNYEKILNFTENVKFYKKLHKKYKIPRKILKFTKTDIGPVEMLFYNSALSLPFVFALVIYFDEINYTLNFPLFNDVGFRVRIPSIRSSFNTNIYFFIKIKLCYLYY